MAALIGLHERLLQERKLPHHGRERLAIDLKRFAVGLGDEHRVVGSLPEE